jgi:hypothetical protein
MTIAKLNSEERESLAVQLADERDEAIKGRKKKGLDAVWANARARYEGKEPTDGNAGGFEKPETLDGPMQAANPTTPMPGKGSTVVLNITRPYVNAGTAMVADILLQAGKLPFSLRTTPISDAQTLLRVLEEYPEALEVLETTAPNLAAKMKVEEDVENGPAAKALELIKDWLKESNWDAAVREQIMEAGKVGTGVIKGPFPTMRAMSAEVEAFLAALPAAFEDPNKGKTVQQKLQAQLRYIPSTEVVKVENCYPDPDSGPDIQNGRFFFEHVPETTRRQLIDFKKDPSYDSGQIDICLAEGPELRDEKKKKKSDKGPFELWIRTGSLSYKHHDGEEELGFQVTVLCNKRIIKSELYWLETQKFPYWLLQWLPRDGCWSGIGISEQAETPQRGVTAAVRALMDNMGYSVGPQILEMEGLIEPDDGNWDLYPYKRWKVKSPLPGVDAVIEAKQALTFLEFTNYLNEIMPVINFWLKMTEDTTGLSLLLQGQAVTEAVGVSQQLMNNATTVLRQVVKEWDNATCRPQISAFYEWAQVYGPPEVRGDAVIEPLGSSSLIIRELQQQALLQIGDKAVQPIYGLSPSKWMKLYLEGFQMNYEQLAMTDEERKTLTEAEQKPDVKIQVAQIEAAADVRIADMRKESETLKTALKVMQDDFNNQQNERAQQLEELIKTVELLQGTDEGKQVQPGAAAAAPNLSPDGATPSQEEVGAALELLEGGQA